MEQRFDTDLRGRKYKNKTSYRNVHSAYPSQFYFTDLIDWSKKDYLVNTEWKKINKNFQYILVVVDAYSRYCWMRNIKTKTYEDVSKAFDSIFDENVYNIAGTVDEITLPERLQNTPKHIVSDRGKEYTSKNIEDFFKSKNIHHITLQGESKAMLAERVIQDYRMYIRNRMSDGIWYNLTKPFVDFYNNKYHSIVKDTPANIFIEGHRARIATNRLTKKDVEPQYEIGDIVKLRVDKNNLKKKSQTNNWSTQNYKVIEIDNRYNPIMYIIADLNNNRMPKKYYHYELLKTA